jgi:hypothetical protein
MAITILCTRDVNFLDSGRGRRDSSWGTHLLGTLTNMIGLAVSFGFFFNDFIRLFPIRKGEIANLNRGISAKWIYNEIGGGENERIGHALLEFDGDFFLRGFIVFPSRGNYKRPGASSLNQPGDAQGGAGPAAGRSGTSNRSGACGYRAGERGGQSTYRGILSRGLRRGDESADGGNFAQSGGRVPKPANRRSCSGKALKNSQKNFQFHHRGHREHGDNLLI